MFSTFGGSIGWLGPVHLSLTLHDFKYFLSGAASFLHDLFTLTTYISVGLVTRVIHLFSLLSQLVKELNWYGRHVGLCDLLLPHTSSCSSNLDYMSSYSFPRGPSCPHHYVSLKRTEFDIRSSESYDFLLSSPPFLSSTVPSSSIGKDDGRTSGRERERGKETSTPNPECCLAIMILWRYQNPRSVLVLDEQTQGRTLASQHLYLKH